MTTLISIFMNNFNEIRQGFSLFVETVYYDIFEKKPIYEQILIPLRIGLYHDECNV